MIGKVISVNVGMPRQIEWRGQFVRTAIWKSPVAGRIMARRLNLEGDGQADLMGHGGENRALLVYQLESYRYWQQLLGDIPYEMGRFGENLTVEGLADADVCIGDRFRIGEVLVEVTQPRVTCYRLGIRMKRPEMPSLLVQHGRPGFYLRILEEGTVGPGDPIERVVSDGAMMSVVDVDHLLYLGKHPVDQLERALSIKALSEGWKDSFRDLLQAQRDGHLVGNPGLSQDVSKEPWQGFRKLSVLSNERESADVRSIVLNAPGGESLPAFHAGQHIVLKTPGPDHKELIRTYSLSGSPEGDRYRISIKRETQGVGSRYLQDLLQPGVEIDASAPRGTFVLDMESAKPVVLLSAGIGVTPLLSMLHSLANSTRDIFWVHGARDGEHLGFRSETKRLLASLPNAKRLIAFSRPGQSDVFGDDYNWTGHVTMDAIKSMQIPKSAEFYLCGPSQFLQSMGDSLSTWGVFPDQIHLETFGGSLGGASTKPRSGTQGDQEFQITLTRSNRVLHWTGDRPSLLEFLEDEKIPVQWSCRVGVCHTCEIGILDGQIEYAPAPLDAPAAGRLLVCCSRPKSNLALDL